MQSVLLFSLRLQHWVQEMDDSAETILQHKLFANVISVKFSLGDEQETIFNLCEQEAGKAAQLCSGGTD